MMIPGAWEPRPQSGAVAEPLASVPTRPVESQGGNSAGTATQPTELAAWLKVSIFAATLLAVMWVAMAMFF